ncbi:CHASE2 domain-containing protein [Propionivibrio dicarboxylicus]|uniref:Adenylate cyclase n=1 Tax=Propionivibrio dicarboxylicus TaxID=83767 RepID=A0A1G8FN46_9RHOO|nr:adenylate/guanylate cyclase domain-containing protein [Propionivibrio dicarboxylicus]SDH83565.1 adenylate cyclase [Propionivibrio dicarboxylicus]
MKRNLVRIVLGLLFGVVLLVHAAKVVQIPLLNTLDAFIYDARLRLTAEGGVDDRVVIIDLDERSLAEVGRWPWSRNTMAALVDRLFDEYGIAVLGFDVVFAEPDNSSGLRSLDALAGGELRGDPAFKSAVGRLRDSLDYDRQFAESLRGHANVLGYYFSNADDARKSGVLPAPALPADAFAGRPIAFTHWNGFGANLAEFQKSAGAAGHFNPLIDFDGVSRRVPMLVEHNGQYYESLSLAVVRSLLGKPPIWPGFPEDGPSAGGDYGGLEWLDLPTAKGALRIPVDENVAALIPFRGRQGSFPYLSAVDALRGRLSPDQLRGRVVLIGTTAPGLMDLRSTPVGNTYPGVEIHANLVAGMLDGALSQKPPYAIGVDTVLVAVTALLLSLLLPILSPLRASLLAFAVLAGVTTLNVMLWSSGVVLPLAAQIVLILSLYALNMSWGYFVESRSKRQFTELFGQYVPPELVDEMARDPERYSMEGKKEELTVLFSDVRGFTSISEGLDSKDLALLMNEYLGAMTQIVQKNRGTLDKYIGDAIMAFWGAPVADPEHARRAVLTALEMQKALRSLDAPFQARGWPVLHIGVGINTGSMTVGDMGSIVRKSYTVMGDAVNLGSRLEGITKQYGVGIIVSETTRAQFDGAVYRELDRVRVKGKDEPVAIFEPLGLVGDVDATVVDMLSRWTQALDDYRRQDWDAAGVQLEFLVRQSPECSLYRLYVDRIARYRLEPPGAAWDGVTTFETK